MKKKGISIFLIVVVVVIIVIAMGIGVFKDTRKNIAGNVIGENNLVAHYSFEKNVKDITGNGYDGGEVPYMIKYSDGRVGKGLDFNKEGIYVIVEDNKGLHLQEFSLSFWSKLNTPFERFQGGVGKGILFSIPQTFSYKIEFNNNNAIAAISNIQNELFELQTPVGDKNWHFWLMAVGNGELKLYKDGVIQGVKDYTGEIDYVKTDNELFIGTSRDPRHLFNGKIDELKIWDSALSEEEVWEEYNSYPMANYCGDGICNPLEENPENCFDDCLECEDSDKGMVYGLKGTCKDFQGNIVTDTCGGEDWLMEAYCDDFGVVTCKTESHGCAFGCSDGACLGE